MVYILDKIVPILNLILIQFYPFEGECHFSSEIDTAEYGAEVSSYLLLTTSSPPHESVRQ